MQSFPLELWRISDFSELNGEGGLLYSARWHTAGRPIVYLAESAAGAMLEVLVHLELEDNDLPRPYNLLKVSVPESIQIERLSISGGDSWKDDERITQAIGNEWLVAERSALARAPSAIMPSTWNYLLNPSHPDAARVEIIEVTPAEFDTRLLRKVHS
jgi:RES domain-containing protein